MATIIPSVESSCGESDRDVRRIVDSICQVLDLGNPDGRGIVERISSRFP
jgi:hypothetical protein